MSKQTDILANRLRRKSAQREFVESMSSEQQDIIEGVHVEDTGNVHMNSTHVEYTSNLLLDSTQVENTSIEHVSETQVQHTSSEHLRRTPVNLFQSQKKRPTIEETHIRKTFIIRRELLAELERLSKTQERGFQTFFINYAIEKAIRELDEK